MCDHRQAVCVESTGGIEAGQFSERYECPCGAVGFVTGNAEEPAEQWKRTGEVFQ